MNSSVKILPIASGSSGNSMLLSLEGKTILIDVGVSAAMIKEALKANSYCFESIEAVLYNSKAS